MIRNTEDLFRFAEHSSEDAERIGFSDYSYWGSVMQNFLKKKRKSHAFKKLPKKLASKAAAENWCKFPFFPI